MSPTQSVPDARPQWRPQLLWLPAGLVLGAGCGAAVGVGLMVFSIWWDGVSYDVPAMIELGATFGAAAGSALGTIIGLALVVVAGRHLDRAAARARALGTSSLVVALGLGALLQPALLTAPGMALWLSATVVAGAACAAVAHVLPRDHE